MIFQYTIDKVMAHKKTQTRRIVKHGEMAFTSYGEAVDQSYHLWSSVDTFSVESVNHWRKWSVGNIYAVQPGRGKKSVGRIQITGIRREDVRNISFEDARAEGFIDRSDFMLTWCNMHDKQLNVLWYDCFHWEQDGEWREGVEEFYAYLRTRPAAFYDAWVLEFKLVED